MSDHIIPHFQNDAGHAAIEIGVKEFMCVGATRLSIIRMCFSTWAMKAKPFARIARRSIATMQSSMPTKPFRLAALTKHLPIKQPDPGC